MRFEAVVAGLEGLDYRPLTSRAVGRLLYSLALGPGVDDVLELGFAHGTSTAYIAAALDEKGSGRLTTIDRPKALERRPNLEELLQGLKLRRWVTPVVASSYNWELMRMLEEATRDETTSPCLDLCFVDGAHSWETDGLAFLLVDRLLRPSGWIVFDDVNWTFAGSPALRESARVAAMAEEERVSAQVRKVIDLLVRPTPGYQVQLLGNLAIAFKGARDAPQLQRFPQLASAFLRESVRGPRPSKP
jgi:predicted O-methyltransferase YrrM